MTIVQAFSLGLGTNFRVRIVSEGELSEPPVLLVVNPVLVTHRVSGHLREEDGRGHVVIVIPHQVPHINRQIISEH